MYSNSLSPAFMKPRRITVDTAFERKKKEKSHTWLASHTFPTPAINHSILLSDMT